MSAGLAARELDDATGRHVALPERVERVMAAGPSAAVVLYVLAPGEMIGWPRRRGRTSASSSFRRPATCPSSAA